jgi:DnaK suppressor protein
LTSEPTWWRTSRIPPRRLFLWWTMARREALLRLHKTLKARRTELGKILTAELANLRDFKAADATGDSADAAFEADSDEMSSRLAELDARELNQVERAHARLLEGSYGLCEGGSSDCQKKIPVARLNALPYTTLCIHCERELEKRRGWQDRRGRGNWGQVRDTQALMQDQRINLGELEIKLSG